MDLAHLYLHGEGIICTYLLDHLIQYSLSASVCHAV